MSDTEKRIQEIEEQMQAHSFWEDKENAQQLIKELSELKKSRSEKQEESKRYAIITIFSGAGGEDAEDFSKILFEMYKGYIRKKGWDIQILHSHENEHGGLKNISFEVLGKGSYELLKYESGVHRLVRISPFNAKKQRHTSFAMVEVIPKLDKVKEFDIPDSDLKVEFSRSGGPGGQNVDKRETAVRMVHLPTDISVQANTERSQESNREKALNILKSKLHHLQEEQKRQEQEEKSVSKDTSIEWGNQIRSYVFHPYQMVKDHRTAVEVNDVDNVLEGDIEKFIEAERDFFEQEQEKA